jgi:hypothetical protein
MSLKNEIEKTMFKEGIEDRIQDIASLIGASVEGVQKRLKTLTFSDYIFVMNAVDNKDKLSIERLLGLIHSPIDDVDDEKEQHRRDVKHGLYGDDEEDEDEDEKEQHRRDVKHGLYGDVDESAYYGSDLSSVRQMKYKDTVKVTDIQWDADDMEDIEHALRVGDLRRDMIVPVPTDLDDEEVDEYISDFITDKTGWTHKGFNIEEGSERMHISPDIAKAHTLKHTFTPIDRDRYQERDGLEGPIMTKAGKVLYYDNVEGKYLDPDTDIYLSYEEWKKLSEAYNMGSQGPEEEQSQSKTDQMVQGNKERQQLTTLRTQAMQRLGRDNLGGATAQQAATAIDKAEQGVALTPIQRQSMAHQAANLDNLAMNPDTRIQFRNLLNKLRKAQADQEGQ